MLLYINSGDRSPNAGDSSIGSTYFLVGLFFQFRIVKVVGPTSRGYTVYFIIIQTKINYIK